MDLFSIPLLPAIHKNSPSEVLFSSHGVCNQDKHCTACNKLVLAVNVTDIIISIIKCQNSLAYLQKITTALNYHYVTKKNN
jgi:hypothetical protein